MSFTKIMKENHQQYILNTLDILAALVLIVVLTLGALKIVGVI